MPIHGSFQQGRPPVARIPRWLPRRAVRPEPGLGGAGEPGREGGGGGGGGEGAGAGAGAGEEVVVVEAVVRHERRLGAGGAPTAPSRARAVCVILLKCITNSEWLP